MSEQQNNTTLVSEPSQMKVKKQRTSKLPALLALLSLSCTVYLGFEGVYGQFGIHQQQVNNSITQQQISTLRQENQDLNKKIQELKDAEANLHQEIQNVTPNQGVIVVNQLSNLLAAANQSLILYHDIPSAIKLINYTLQIVSAHNEPQYADIKISLTKDLEAIQAMNTFDNTVVAAKIENAYQLSLKLDTVTTTSPDKATDKSSATQSSAWDRFISNMKSTFLGAVKIEAANKADTNLMPNETQLLHQHLQLDILNARQAFVSRNQTLWQQSLNDAIELSSKYFATNQDQVQEIQILRDLLSINLDSGKANLDASMQSLIKLQQLMPTNTVESAN